MSAKAFGDFYCYLHCLNLLSIKEQGITSKEYLDDVRKEPFYYRGGTSKEAQQKWAERILDSIYKYHGAQGDGPNGHNDLLVREGIASKARYKVKEGAEFNVNPGLSDSISMLSIIGNQLRERLLPSAGAKLNDALTLISRVKTTLNNAPFKIQVSCYDLVAPQIEQSVLYDLESALENRQVLSFDYNNHRCEVDPYGSFVYQKVFYLVARERYKRNSNGSSMSGEMRTYTMHKINNIEIRSNQSFSMGNQSEFCLHAYLSTTKGKWVNGGETCEVLLKMMRDSEGNSKFVNEFKLSECQEIEETSKNHYIVRARVRDSLDFKHWLINNADCVEILKPLRLRTDVILDIKHAMNVYAH
ncbi:putative DNA-binding transcriptional regulator YafY [Vibrio crassostreae]|nr:putative DNA-binding transcriptional regulator YafY [Vibrio crassostreae]CAK3037605.1 putative DNA-binding transcriptional regulator YafY [Vibrio crassostreae]CAK3037901.1 putative DNA-binding transcriptional regulator YafY [Vibrio crassostreae]CAK3040087.1 putative DNA-binding transcriptional regulator YafY [Vibrio crassostreae]CAK3040324.1 putative DNA-binding transcriptional regulator YafY [Vibrio crassostreae]